MTDAALKMLHAAFNAADKTVRAGGFGKAPFTTATAKTLEKRGLIVWVKKTWGGHVYRLTEAGIRAVMDKHYD